MDSGEKRKTESAAKPNSVTVETLGIILGSAVLGATAAFCILRAMQGGVETISITGLLGFMLMLVLCISAIVLSVVAIVLSRAAERAIARKAEEMNALHAGLAAQTDEAIARMESSVRQIGDELADTIYDNFEMLAEEIQDSLPSRDVLRADVTAAVERSLADVQAGRDTPAADPDEAAVPAEAVAEDPVPEPEAVVEEIPVVDEEAVLPPPEPVTDEMRDTADRKYGEFKDIVLLGVANYPGVIARKIGEGHYRTEGDELVDGAFVIQNEAVAVCTFCTDPAIIDRFMGEHGDSFNGFLRSLRTELKSGRFTRVFLVFDGQLTNASPYAKALNTASGSMDADSFARFELFEGKPAVIIPELTERVSQLMEALPEEAGGDVPELSFRKIAGA